MKILLSITAVLVMASSCYGWMHPFPDYKNQYDASDLVAVVRILKISDTGFTNQLNQNSRLLFREFEVEMGIVSVFKGEDAKTIKCRLYRFPIEAERNADLGKMDASREYLKATPWESGLFIPKQWMNYLVYLKRSGDGRYLPVGGYQRAVFGIVELNVPFTSDPDRRAKPNGVTDGNQPIRSETNRTSSAAGSRR